MSLKDKPTLYDRLNGYINNDPLTNVELAVLNDKIEIAIKLAREFDSGKAILHYYYSIENTIKNIMYARKMV